MLTLFLFCFRRFTPARARRGETAEDFFRIDLAEVVLTESHKVAARLTLGDADHFARERLADEQVFAAPLDFAVPTHPSHFMIGVIPGVVDPSGHRPSRRAPAFGGRRLVQRLARTLLVEVPAKGVETILLFAGGLRRRPRRLRLQRAVHAFMPPVVLRRGGATETRLDAELEQPYRQARESARADRTERRPIVGAQRQGKAELPEKTIKARLDLFVGRPHDLDAEQIAARIVRQRQRIDPLSVGTAKSSGAANT